MGRYAQTRSRHCPVCKHKDLRPLYEYGDGVTLHCGECGSLLFRSAGMTKWAGHWLDGLDLDGTELVDAAMRDGHIPAEDHEKSYIEWALKFDVGGWRRRPRRKDRKEPGPEDAPMSKEMRAERKRLAAGLLLTRIRTKLGLTQKEMAVKLGNTSSTGNNEYCRWENARHQAPPTAIAFARHLEDEYDAVMAVKGKQ